MNIFEKYPTPWRRFVQVGLILVLGCLVTSGIIALHVLQAESAEAREMVLAGGLLWIAILLWGIFSMQMMAFVNTKCSLTPWRRFVQVGLIWVLGLLVTLGIYAYALHVLQAESAKGSVMMLAGGLLWIAMLLWGVCSLQMMAFLNTKCRAA